MMHEEPAPTQSAIGSSIAQAQKDSIAIVAGRDVSISALIPPPRPVEAATLEAAQQQLAALPLERIPERDEAGLPAGSHLPEMSPNTYFVGRAASLRRLAAALKGEQRQGGSIVPIVVVTGIGGLGKTQLATEFLYCYGSYFAGGVFWLNFADASGVATQLEACGTALGMELPSGKRPPLETVVQWVRSAWQSPLPRLLIFDNCEEESLLEQWRPRTGGCRVLVTSRQARWTAQSGVIQLSLDVLSRAESIELLQKHRPDLRAADLAPIAQQLGDLPLALHLAGSFLHTYRTARLGMPAAYLAQLRKLALQDPALQGKGSRQSPTRHEQNVERTFMVSYQRLQTTDKTDERARRLLARAACFAPGISLPRELLKATLSEPEESVEEELEVEDALERLIAFGLLEEVEESVVRLHQLLATFVSRNRAMTDAEAQPTVEEVMRARAISLNQARDPRPLLSLQEHLRVVTDKAQQRSDERAAGLCGELVAHLQMIGAYGEALPYAQRALAIYEQVLGPQHPHTASSLNNLAELYRAQGQYEQAEPLYQRALAITEQVLGPQHPHTARVLENYAVLLWKMEREDEARELIRRMLLIQSMTTQEELPSSE